MRFWAVLGAGLALLTPMLFVGGCSQSSADAPSVFTPPKCTPSDDHDGDGFCKSLGDARAEDCDDEDPNRHPGASEACNLRDDDCDGVIDNGASAACALSCDAPADGCETVTAITAGSAHACALTSTGRVLCWGNRGLGTPHVSSSPVPVPVPGVVGATAIAGSGSYTCALVADHAICWGELMAYTFAIRLFPGIKQIAVSNSDIFVLGADGFVSSLPILPSRGESRHLDGLPVTPQIRVFASPQRVCMVDAQGVLSCPAYRSVGPFKGVTAVTASGVGSVDVTRDDAVCYTQGSDLTCVNIGAPQEVVAASGSAIGIVKSKNYACIFDEAGKTSCWSPAGPRTITDAQSLAVGDDFGCVLRKSGTVSCWGHRNEGALGDGKAGAGVESEPVDILTAGAVELPSSVLLSEQPLGACDSEADVSYLGDNGTGATHALFLGCGAQCKDRPDAADCVATCAKITGLSAGCFACFAGLAGCPGHDCYDAFNACAGFPVDFVQNPYNAPRFGCQGADCLVGAPLGQACTIGADCLSGACDKLPQFADHAVCVVSDGAYCEPASGYCACHMGEEEPFLAALGHCGDCVGEGRLSTPRGECSRDCTAASYCEVGQICRSVSDGDDKYCAYY